MTRDEINTVANLIKRMAVQLEQERSAHKTALAEMRASFVARAGAYEKLIEGYRRQIVSLGAANDRLNDLLRVERLAHQDKVATDYREPCDQPKATPVMPKPGDMVRLVSRPERDNVDKNLRTALWWPWEDRWGVVGETRKVVAGCRYIPGAVAVAVATDIYAHWPLSCVEVVSEATHDTEAGKAVAESALKTEPVERGDLVKVFQATGSMTDAEDIGCGGVVREVDVDGVSLSRHYTMDLPRQGLASLSDVRKVTT